VAKRKSFARQAWEERQRNKREKQRLEEAGKRHELAVEREQRQQRRDRQRQREAAERRKRQTALELEREDAAQKRQYEQIMAEQGTARAKARTADIDAKIAAIESVLTDRSRDLARHHAALVDAVAAGDPAVVGDTVQSALTASTYPTDVPVTCQAHYKAEAGELLIDCELPRQDVLPAVARYRYIKTKKEERATARTEADRKRIYGRLIARIALRVTREAFDATPPAVVGTVTMNAHVSAVHTATGRPIRSCLISVMAERDEFDQLHLDAPELDPQHCLRYLNAIVSPHPYDLEAVRPVAEFDLSKYKFVEEMQVAAGLDSRPDLLDLTPTEFEHLVRELFQATGMRAWVTQASRDEGVDAVATNPDPVLGGLCVIQAKRYKNLVGLEAVHALAGVMDDKAAAKGILITTSWFGKATYKFATRNGRIQLIDGRGLKAMMHDQLGRDVLIGLPKLPPGWARHDVT
jgi:restriction system protein